MQGFYVHANDINPQLTVPQTSRLHHTQEFRSPQSTNEHIRLTVSSANYSDEIIIRVNENSTIEFDEQYDAYKLYGINSAPQLYCYTENDILSVNNMPMVDSRIDAHIGFMAGIPEIHTIIADGADNFDEEVFISLEDTQEDLIINLKTDSSYAYYASPGDDPNRFILHIDAGTVNIQHFDKPTENIIYLYNQNIIVENTQGNMLNGEIKVYDLLGRLQFNDDFDGNIKQVFEPFLKSGTYIVMISNKTDIQTHKILINN